MKKLIALLLALVLCLSLCACGSEVEGTHEPKDTEPVTNKLNTSKVEENTEIEEETVETTESPYANHPNLQYLYGEWEINSGYENDDVAFRSLIVNEDGTCIVDGISATWNISEMSTESRLRIDIYNGAEMICSADYKGEYDNIGGYKANGRACIGSYTNLSRSE